MRGCRQAVIILVLFLGAACAPRQIRPVAATDPAPLLEAVHARRAVLERGLSGTLELAYRNGRQRFNGRVYIVAFPDGRFRLEIPGPLGGTHLVMASDGREILAYYPGEDRAYRSDVNGRAINPHLPFPLPLDTATLPALIMGAVPTRGSVQEAEAWLMDSGDKLLRVMQAGNGLRFDYLFVKGHVDRLREITIRGRDLKVFLRTGPDPDHLPRDFELTFSEGVLKGEWDSAALFTGDETALGLRLPGSVPVTDLETLP